MSRRSGKKRKTSWEVRKAAIRAKAMASYERRKADLTSADFLWCLHCERVWLRKNRQTWCPGEGCDGGGLDWWPWKKLVRLHGYPEVPVPGTRYALYPAGE